MKKLKKLKKYEIYHKLTGVVLSYGFNEFTAMNNMVSLRKKYGDNLDIRWVEA